MQLVDDVAAGFGLKLPLDDVFLTREIRLEILVLDLSTHTALTFEQLQSHIGRTQVAAHADEVGVLSARAIDDIALRSLAQAGDADDKTRYRCAGVAPNEVHTIMLTGDAHALVELLNVLQGETLADA